MKRSLGSLAALALVVLGSRTIAYALSPSPLAAELSHQAGGPALPVIAVVAVLLAVAFSAAIVWLAALGVRERRLLETRPLVAEPRLRLGLLAARALALWLVAMATFALLESTIHGREGLRQLQACARRSGNRRGYRGHAGSLARADGHRRGGSRQRRLRRKAHGA